MKTQKMIHSAYTVEIEAPELYMDNEARGRSGHMSHAMAEFAPGCFIDFNSNCSALRCDGHMPYGWVEYRISRDAGKNYSEPMTLPYSWQSFLDGIYTVSVEKAVACPDGRIVAFCLRNDAQTQECCTPWSTPTVIVSEDEGKNWSEPYELCQYAGRVYDAVIHDGVIYALEFCNENFIGKTPEHLYRIYRSDDFGETFCEWSVIPFETRHRGYGALLVDAQGNLHAYAYNNSNECEMDHAVSHDGGKSWTVLPTCHLEKGIRNPQLALLDGVYLLHGRAKGREGFVLYSSTDASVWDEGCFVVKKNALAFYSDNLNLKDEDGEFLLIQYSDSYLGDRVNVMHTRVRIKRP